MSNCDDGMKELAKPPAEAQPPAEASSVSAEAPSVSAEAPSEAEAPSAALESLAKPLLDSVLAVRPPSALLMVAPSPSPLVWVPPAPAPETEMAGPPNASEGVPLAAEPPVPEEAPQEEEGALRVPESTPPKAAALVEAFVSSWPARQHVSPASLALDSIDEDDTFRLRKKDDSISALAVELARLGQLTPIDVRLLPSNRFQIITGFRRVEALRFLHRDRVVARIHLDLSDADAWLLALASSIHASPASAAALLELQKKLEDAGQLQPLLRDMLERALVPGASGAYARENAGEVDADELAMDVAMRMATLNQDLSLVADIFLELEPAGRVMLLKQLRYANDMVAYLERLE